jgi:hypothetical protein
MWRPLQILLDIVFRRTIREHFKSGKPQVATVFAGSVGALLQIQPNMGI